MSETLEKTLRKKLTEAMKARDAATADLIRMINTRVMERRTQKGFKGEVDDALYVDVIAAHQKQMKKAIADYEKAGERGAEHVAQARFEIDWCAQFLPEMMSEEEIRAAVAEAIAEVGADGPKQVGRVIGAVMKKHKGRVDAADVKPIAVAALSS